MANFMFKPSWVTGYAEYLVKPCSGCFWESGSVGDLPLNGQTK
jgi:hypothetical protein